MNKRDSIGPEEEMVLSFLHESNNVRRSRKSRLPWGNSRKKRSSRDQSRETAAAVVGHRSSLEMLSPFHGFPVHDVLIPPVDTRG